MPANQRLPKDLLQELSKIAAREGVRRIEVVEVFLTKGVETYWTSEEEKQSQR